jgi:hypothetical protein
VDEFAAGWARAEGACVIDAWRDGNWKCANLLPSPAERQKLFDCGLHGSFAATLIVMQRDRSIERVEIEPSKLRKFGIGKRGVEPHAPGREITLYCPKRIYNSDGASTHASPYAHPRSGHWKMQPCGKGRTERKRIYVEMYWVNLAEGEDPGNGPPRKFRLR